MKVFIGFFSYIIALLLVTDSIKIYIIERHCLEIIAMTGLVQRDREDTHLQDSEHYPPIRMDKRKEVTV
jgi:hypothetical protein